jgi:plastocyanin
MRVLRASLLAGGIIGATLCAPGPLPAAEAQDAPGLLEASIVDFAFEPETIEVEVGTTVRWTNEGELPHFVTDRGGTFDTQPILPGRSRRVNFSVPGTYTYFCRIHATRMEATVVVGGAGEGARVNRIQATEFAFEPADLTVRTGSLVLLANAGELPHTLTAESGLFDTGMVAPGPGAKFAGSNVSVTMRRPGTFPFICQVHPDVMRGTLTVVGAATDGGAADSAAPQEASVSVVDFAFEPLQVSVAPGGEVTWTNDGGTPHTATFDVVELDTDVLDPGTGGTLTAPEEAGSYSYRCNIHPTQMRGVLVVVGPGQEDPTARGSGGEIALAGGGGALPWVALAIGVVAAFLGGFAISAFARNKWGQG